MNGLRIALHITCRQNAPVCRQQMWGELDLHLAPGNGGELLIEFAQVTVRATKRIGVIAFREFRMQQVFLQGTARTGDTTFQIHDDLIKINHPSFNQGTQSELSGRGVTAGAGHQTGVFDLIAVKFRQAVNSLFLDLHRGMFIAIPGSISFRITQAEISREIHDLQITRQGADHFLAGLMRQGAETQIDL